MRGCHGENGISQTENIPSLAAQPDLFMQWQLVFFRAGTRKSEQMQPIARTLKNEDIRNLGAYYASLAPPKRVEATTIPISRKRARRPRSDAAARRATPIPLPELKPTARIAAQREEYLLRRCMTTSRASDRAAAWRRWRRSPIP